MFKTGEFAIKNGFGVLEIVDIIKQSFLGGGSEDYYKLVSMDKKTVVNVPVSRASTLIRPILTTEEARNIIENVLSFAVNLDPNEKVRRKFLEDRSAGEREDSLVVVGSIIKRLAMGKKLAFFERTAFDVAGDKIFGEVAFVLSSTKEKVKQECLKSAGVEM